MRDCYVNSIKKNQTQPQAEVKVKTRVRSQGFSPLQKNPKSKAARIEKDQTDAEAGAVSRRLKGQGAICVALFLILAFNLWRLQIVNADYYAEKAMGNVFKPAAIPTVRGPIVDKNGVVLAKSVSNMAVVLDWTELQGQDEQWQDIIKRLANYIKPYWPFAQSPELIAEDICVLVRNQQWNTYKPVVVMEGVPESLRAVIAEHSYELPGVRVEPLAKRVYPNGTLMGQVLGYIREISQEELDTYYAPSGAVRTESQDGIMTMSTETETEAEKETAAEQETEIETKTQTKTEEKGHTEKTSEYIYRQGDLVGKMGIEKSFDLWLRGREGLDRVEIDGKGRPVSRIMEKPPQLGSTVYLTVDSALQREVEKSLDEVMERVKKTTDPKAGAGAAVVMEVKTGRVLAMVSKPDMDPNELVGKMSEDMVAKYFTAPEAVTKNRAIMDIYPPGSVYKMIIASSALELGVVTPQDKVYDALSSLGPAGVQAQATPEWGNNNFGWVDLNRALAKSSNIYFQSIGRRVFDKDPEYVKEISQAFGLGVLSGINLPGEVAGTAPSPSWKNQYFAPIYETRYQEKRQEIEERYNSLLDQARGQEEIEKLATQKKGEMETLVADYEANKAYYVDWRLSDSFFNSIGQGYNSYTLLQLANYVATLANGGTRYKPQIVEKIVDTVTGEIIENYEPEILNQVPISPENLAVLKNAMSGVTKGEGTAAFVFADMPKYTGGGKTGTAQVGNKDSANYFNGIYVAFAPYDDPQIAVAVMVEYGGTGGDTAGRVAKAVFKSYFGW